MNKRCPQPVILGTGFLHPAGTAAEIRDHMARNTALAMRDNWDPTPQLGTLFPIGQLRRIPMYARMGLQAAVMALNDAKLFPCPEDTGLVIGSSWGCQKTSCDFMDSILDNGPRLSSPMAFSHAVNNMAAGLISLMLKIKGPCFTINNQELSFAGALQTGITLLKNRRCAYALVGALDEADARLRRVFPSMPMLPGAFFVCLALRGRGVSADVRWPAERRNDNSVIHTRDTQDELNLSSLPGDALKQALGCALALEYLKQGADAARIVQAAAITGTQACISLKII
ncbi:MAG: beta-ketoacyl synthase chain length factor [Desulfovibrionaceae bacterium]|nr:beta-ketoacyl synthase chain length factor [Desulfovibrionaceae bacterium]